jgi:hypothetical protein
MADNVALEPGFCQQVAAEALKNIPNFSFRCKSRDGSIHAGLLSRLEGPQESLREMRCH